MDECWYCLEHGMTYMRQLASGKTKEVYRWCEKCGVDPIARIFELEKEIRNKK